MESAPLGDGRAGTERLPPGPLREPDGIAGRALEEFGVEAEALSKAIVSLDGDASSQTLATLRVSRGQGCPCP